jgi:hypothetical protein
MELGRLNRTTCGDEALREPLRPETVKMPQFLGVKIRRRIKWAGLKSGRNLPEAQGALIKSPDTIYPNCDALTGESLISDHLILAVIRRNVFPRDVGFLLGRRGRCATRDSRG